MPMGRWEGTGEEKKKGAPCILNLMPMCLEH